MSTLPHPSELTATQAILEVNAYDRDSDAFECTMHTSAPCDGTPCVIPAILLPMLVHEYGPPTMFILRSFLVEQGIKRADYETVRRGLLSIRNTAEFGDDGSYKVHARHISNAEQVLRDTPKQAD